MESVSRMESVRFRGINEMEGDDIRARITLAFTDLLVVEEETLEFETGS